VNARGDPLVCVAVEEIGSGRIAAPGGWESGTVLRSRVTVSDAFPGPRRWMIGTSGMGTHHIPHVTAGPVTPRR
jgi:hypothetical protein